MKTLSKLVLCAVLSGAAVTYAGPPSQHDRAAAKLRDARTQAQTAPTPSQPQASGLTCSYMTVPSIGRGFSKTVMATVRCTPDMLAKDSRCQQACAASADKR